MSKEIDENNIEQSIEQLAIIKQIKEQLNAMSKKILGRVGKLENAQK